MSRYLIERHLAGVLEVPKAAADRVTQAETVVEVSEGRPEMFT